MIISEKILKAKKDYYCDYCNKIIYTNDIYVRLFGSSDDACKNPKPSELKLCSCCGHIIIERERKLK